VLHVRADDEDAVYLALGMTAYETRAEATAWINPSYFSVPSDQVVTVTLENEHGRFQFEKDESGEWTMRGLGADETLNQNNVRALVNRVASVQMQRPLGREALDAYGLDDPTAVVTVVTRDEAGSEKTYVLRVGAAQDDEGFVAKSVTSPYYVLVADYTVSMFIERGREDFLELPPTPEPTPESALEPTAWYG
jgi:hypothetical protein